MFNGFFERLTTVVLSLIFSVVLGAATKSFWVGYLLCGFFIAMCQWVKNGITDEGGYSSIILSFFLWPITVFMI